MKLEKQSTEFEDLLVLTRQKFADVRGSFQRLYCLETLREFGVTKSIRQINCSDTKLKGTVRGLHYQVAPYAETKIITCLSGRVFDVALDLRKESTTYGRYFSIVLDETEAQAVVIPEGFAHGFQTLTNNARLLYLHTSDYNKDAEAGVHPLDKDVGIDWPHAITMISDRDDTLPFFNTINSN